MDKHLIMVYDLETSGLPLFREPSTHPGQPHIVQVAAGLYTPEGDPVELYDTIVRPDGWTIPQEVADIHGITTERALAEGIPEADMLQKVDAMWSRARLRVAHNEQFDARIMRIAYCRFRTKALADQWKDGPAECTQRMATPILALPPTEKMRRAGRHHHKSANLSECIRHFFDRDHGDAHTATADRDGCADVYFHIKAGRHLLAAPVAAAPPAQVDMFPPDDEPVL